MWVNSFIEALIICEGPCPDFLTDCETAIKFRACFTTKLYKHQQSLFLNSSAQLVK